MPRKPVHLELAGGKSQRQRIWDMIRARPKNQERFSQRDVTPGGIADDTARDFLRALVKADIVRIVRPHDNRGTVTLYDLFDDRGAEVPRINKRGETVDQGQGNEAIWGAMQALGTFSYRLLAEMSGATEQTVKSYCLMLARAGYLQTDQPAKSTGRGGTPAKFRLLKSRINGPRPPMITRLKAVYDPNIHQIVWQEGADEAVEVTA